MIQLNWASQVALVVKNPAAKAGASGSVPEPGRSSGRTHSNPLQYSCLENSMDREAWWGTVHGTQRVKHNWAHTYNAEKELSWSFLVYVHRLFVPMWNASNTVLSFFSFFSLSLVAYTQKYLHLFIGFGIIFISNFKMVSIVHLLLKHIQLGSVPSKSSLPVLVFSIPSGR